MITRTGDAVTPDDPTELTGYEVVCHVHNLTYHRPLGECPECADARPMEQERG